MQNYLVKFLVLTLCFFLFSSNQASKTTIDKKLKVYEFSIKDEIGPPTWRVTKKAIDEAIAIKADIIFLRLNTYGGLVDAADSIRTKILNCPIPIYVLIENNAASAGALISIACDKIFMQPGSTIGAATVVNQSGEAVPDKYQSYMRKKMRATAEETGRNPDIAEAMVDPDKEVEGISEIGKVLTLTVTEAINYGFCESEAKNIEEVFNKLNLTNYEIVKQKIKPLDKLIGWLINPAISGILILVMIGGIYFELQSPGVGFPIVASIAAAIVYFAPFYLEGLAENWEILLFITGLILIAVEIFFIPGFGVAGIPGIILVIGGLTLSMIGNIGFDFSGIEISSIISSLLIVLLSSLASITGSIYLATKLFNSHLLGRFVLQTSEEVKEGYVGTDVLEKSNFIGKKGIASTILRPSGKVNIDGEILDATSINSYIEKGDAIIVKKVESAQLFVSKER